VPTLRILLVDDHAQFLDSLAQFLSVDARLEVVGRASSGTAALRRVAQLSPDLALIDLSMPDMNGLEATRRLKRLPNAPRVIILTLHDQSPYRTAARSAGADGFVSKSEFGTQLLPLIFALFAGFAPNEDDANR
jgi:DNA-binding NarL/FixJ family response regulator